MHRHRRLIMRRDPELALLICQLEVETARLTLQDRLTRQWIAQARLPNELPQVRRLVDLARKSNRLARFIAADVRTLTARLQRRNQPPRQVLAPSALLPG